VSEEPKSYKFTGIGNLSELLSDVASQLIAGGHTTEGLGVKIASQLLAEFGDIWQHNKRQTFYTEMFQGTYQTSHPSGKDMDGIDVTVYRSIDTGAIYVRPTNEFTSDRFTFIDDAGV
jgi:hypothetical protein